MLLGTFAFANTDTIAEDDSSIELNLAESLELEAKQDNADLGCDFLFVFVSSCGTTNTECGEYNTVYFLSDLSLTWEIYNAIDC